MNCKIIFFLFVIIFNPDKIFSQPVKEWVNRYNGPGNSFDIVSKSIIDKYNNIYVYGSSVGMGTLTDMTVIKYSNGGKEIWTARYNGTGNGTDQINSACLDKLDNFFITGFTSDSSSTINLTTVKYDSAGKIIWMKIFHDNSFLSSYGQDVAIDTLGNVLICGAVRDKIDGRYKIIYIGYSNDGNTLGKIVINENGEGDDAPVKIRIDNINNVIIAGSANTNPNNKDLFLIKFGSSFNLLWTKSINGTSNTDDYTSDIILDENNNIYLCGSINNNFTSSDYYYTKINPYGMTVWEGYYNGNGNYADIPSSISIDSLKNTYITGYVFSDSAFGSEDMLTLKISPGGVKIWEAQYNGLANGIDLGNSITTDNSGNVYVGGATERGFTQTTFALLKYNSSGILQWFIDYEGASVCEDFVYNVKLDIANNIYATGISLGEGTDYDFTTIKYSQTTGVNSISQITPDKYYLSQNYPNPFNPGTVIGYQLYVSNNVSIKVCDILGKGVATLINQKQKAGSYKIGFDGSNLPSGIYFYSLLVDGNNIDTKQMLLLK